MAGNSASRLGKKRAALAEDSLKAEIKRKKKNDEKPASDDEDPEEEKEDAAPAVNLIRFLPDLFLVERLLPSKLDFDTPDDVWAIPTWQNLWRL
ncbi:uncharacterized protein CDV56_103578 [Aspergillus thermomutatus]|uniref:Uncharacterized protein n=1 Tax=Aspergillus thermomutatus TaxID=41047 RepID=A0A397GFV0_ASPTH|nr:uncharacterized protein CDV56_103578 [Aspergillus thermomutatus]RHZ47883.1 hypothetical protein CDV56_103578 [Aspergillus thermomutatus]